MSVPSENAALIGALRHHVAQRWAVYRGTSTFALFLSDDAHPQERKCYCYGRCHYRFGR